MRKTVLLTLVLVLQATIAGAQGPAVRTPTTMAETFLSRVGKGDVVGAYDDLLRGSPMAGQSMQVDALKRQTQAFVPLYGKALGFELYRQEKFGESLVRLIYIQRLDKHPLVWKFWFYHPADRWQLNFIVFNDQLNFD